MAIIDLSHPLGAATPPFPGDPPVEIRTVSSTDASSAGAEHGSRIVTSQIRTCLHCGTHLDAPSHFFAGGSAIDAVALETCVGPATLARLPVGAGAVIGPADLEPLAASFASTRRAILETGWHRRWGMPGYFEDHPVLSRDAARFLIEQGVVLVGIDAPSVDREPYPAHLELLGAGVLILENLAHLDAIPGDVFDLIALPLAITGRDGSPVRAVALSKNDPGA